MKNLNILLSVALISALIWVGCSQRSSKLELQPDGSSPSSATQSNTVSNPLLVNMCNFSGLQEGVKNGLCQVRQNDWLNSSEIIFYEIKESTFKYYGFEPLPIKNCSLQNSEDLAGMYAPGWPLRVERKISESLAEHYSDHYEVIYQVSRLDLDEPCSLLLVFKLKQHRVTFLPQKIIKLNYRREVIDPENEVYWDILIRDKDDSLLLGESKGIRPQVWDKKLWPEFSLEIAKEPTCRDPLHPSVQILRVSLNNSNSEQCTLDGGMMRCCDIEGRSYKVFSETAWRNDKYPKSKDTVFIMVGRSDVLEYVAQ